MSITTTTTARLATFLAVPSRTAAQAQQLLPPPFPSSLPLFFRASVVVKLILASLITFRV